MRYRRAWMPGGTYFFTLVTYRRQPILLNPANLKRLGIAFRHICRRYPYHLDGVVVLPDHLHCLLRLPADDADFAVRVRLIKSYFTRAATGVVAKQSSSRKRHHERPVWQRRYWEHLIRDRDDWRRHLDYLHFNPVKHGYVRDVSEWRYSSFHRYVHSGMYSAGWGAQEAPRIQAMKLE